MIYVHVPFCRSFCTYCDFYSEIADDKMFARYTDAVCEEIRRRRDEFDSRLHTLYFGGGTPSVLPLASLTRIVLALQDIGFGAPFDEFTLEANPEDIAEKGLPYLQSLRSIGVDRLSLGIQSFDDRLLTWMNRRHNAERAEKAFRLAREAGFGNISIDLIFGLSNLENDVWAATIDKAIQLGAEHISCYQLSVDGDSTLAHMVEKGQYIPADDEKCAGQYSILCEKLGQAGYRHYEISNFAKPGFEARHNSGYWARMPYVGLGPSAHSFRDPMRSWNTPALSNYTRSSEILTDEDRLVETVMLSLRTDRGIDGNYLRKACEQENVDRMVREGSLVLMEGGRYRIPEDRFFTSDAIIRELI